MPIKVDIIDNSSQVRVKPKSQDEVYVKGGCETTGKHLEAKIDKEIVDRKEADAELQRQIITKQDKIVFITLFDAHGTLEEEVLNLLISSRLNRLVYLDSVYSLSTEDGRYWRYIGETTDPNTLHTIVVDTITGEYDFSEISAGIKFTVGWNGESTPDVTKIPLGVEVKYSGQTYTGTLVASADTASFINLVYKKTKDERKIYTEYITVTEGTGESGDPYTYFWEKLGDTDISIDDLGSLAYKDNATGSTTLATVDSASFSNGSVSTNATYTPTGSVSTPTITVTPSTTSVQVKDDDGSVTAGSPASFSSGTFNGGSFTQGTDQFTAPVLTTTVADEILTIGFSAGSFSQGSDSFTPASHDADIFTANTPTAVTLPTFKEQTVATGIESASSTQPSFTGTETTINSSGTASGDITLTKTDKTITITVS